eukprot:sb/3478712/
MEGHQSAETVPVGTASEDWPVACPGALKQCDHPVVTQEIAHFPQQTQDPLNSVDVAWGRLGGAGKKQRQHSPRRDNQSLYVVALLWRCHVAPPRKSWIS